mgnify:CR=1 FL=1
MASDVLVIGGGAAGMMAAITAARAGKIAFSGVERDTGILLGPVGRKVDRTEIELMQFFLFHNVLIIPYTGRVPQNRM